MICMGCFKSFIALKYFLSGFQEATSAEQPAMETL